MPAALPMTELNAVHTVIGMIRVTVPEEWAGECGNTPGPWHLEV